jgi:N-hydroxyarylamine O-acetyltransferase
VTDLPTYLRRIGYRGTPRPDLATLVELHRRHLLAIAYENLDVQLGRPVGLDIGPIYDKLVLGRRGGWCYEMNGLFAWALDEIGFSVTRMAAAVGRARVGDAATGNHLALRVDLEESYLADVGFGDGIFEPVPLRAGPISQRGVAFRLEDLSGGWWRMHNRPHAGAPSFDFRAEPCERSVLERQCLRLQTSPESPFRKVAVAQRHMEGGFAVLRGRLLRRLEGRRVDERVIHDRRDYERVLREVFDLEPPDMHLLWEKVVEQHRAFLAAQAGARAVTAS